MQYIMQQIEKCSAVVITYVKNIQNNDDLYSALHFQSKSKLTSAATVNIEKSQLIATTNFLKNAE
jgi:hypothetical protein